MIFTWVKYGKPDVSMCLNASLAGLVGHHSQLRRDRLLRRALPIGVVSGLLVGLWRVCSTSKLHIDDPVGAVAVHCLNGIWGTLAVGLFTTDTAPAFARQMEAGGFVAMAVYGGGLAQLGMQCVGVLAVAAWTAVTITITFVIIKKTIGLRVSREEETLGLDLTEHGLPSAYAGFATLPEVIDDGEPSRLRAIPPWLRQSK